MPDPLAQQGIAQQGIAQQWLTAVIETCQRNKDHADSAIAQLSEAQLRQSLDAETNSIAVVMKHMAGNLRSRWRDFLTTDGEKPDRNRDGEFVDDYPDRASILADWDDGWRVMLNSLTTLKPDDFLKDVSIRGCSLSVPHAIARSMSHNSYHIGQIIQTARILAGDNWQTLSIARGQSEEYNCERWGKD